MKTAIRLDDITINMDWERFRKVEAILDKAGICPLIGVVPLNEDENLDRSSGSAAWDRTVTDAIPKDEEEWAAFLKALTDKGWVIAMHGYKHVYTTGRKGLFPLNDFSEFAGVSYFEQLGMLKEGMEKLKGWGIETDIFMAPGHTYDRNTLRALDAVGLTRVTDGFGRHPYKRVIRNSGRVGTVKFYPISKMRKECTSDKEGYTTHVLHCNTMEDKDIDELREMIENNREHFMDYAEYLPEGGEVRGLLGNTAEYLTALVKYLYVRVRTFIRTSGDDGTDDDELSDAQGETDTEDKGKDSI